MNYNEAAPPIEFAATDDDEDDASEEALRDSSRPSRPSSPMLPTTPSSIRRVKEGRRTVDSNSSDDKKRDWIKNDDLNARKDIDWNWI